MCVTAADGKRPGEKFVSCGKLHGPDLLNTGDIFLFFETPIKVNEIISVATCFNVQRSEGSSELRIVHLTPALPARLEK